MDYELDVLGLESGQGQQVYIFSRTSELAPGLTQPPIKCYPRPSAGGNVTGA